MRIIAVDDERLMLKELEWAIRSVVPECRLSCFSDPVSALEHAEKEQVDVAFLDVMMGGMDGIELAKRLKRIRVETNIVFFTGHSEYALDAFAIPACGYILKPVTEEAVRHALEHLRNPIVRANPKVRVQCFGSFEVFVDNSPLYFPRSKAKEALAYLIHKRGACCTINELIQLLFDDWRYNTSVKSQVQTVIATMTKVLREVGAEEIIFKRHNNLAINMEKVDCDYYRFLEKDEDVKNTYMGEYMTNYSWAKLTAGFLNKSVE